MPVNKFNLPTVFVIFGITGDLVKRKILIGLFHLYSKKLLPEKIQVFGFSRRDWTDEDLRKYLKEILVFFDQVIVDSFLQHFFYVQGDFDTASSYEDLANKLGRIDGEWSVCSNKLFYLAVPPLSYETIVTHLKKSGLTIPCSPEEGWTRVILEKPFGSNLKTAQDLDVLLAQLFKEEQIYRVDHYLGKETVRNILAFRFTNAFLKPAWNNKNIDHIHIRLCEKGTVSTRGDFYDGVGALRDVGQNHLLQLLTLFTMDDPGSLTTEHIRNKRLNILQKIKPLTAEEVALQTIHGQYDGYTKEEGVLHDSKTETYFKVQLFIDDPDWYGVPIILEAGKAMDRDEVEVKVRFKEIKTSMQLYKGNYCQNTLSYKIQPHEKITFSFLVKQPGHENELKEKDFEFDYKKEFKPEEFVEAYEKLILDMVKGDQTLFLSTAEVLAEWNVVESVVTAWNKSIPPLITYKREEYFHPHFLSLPFSKEIAIFGLGKMGGGIALQLLEKGWNVVGYNRTYAKTETFLEVGIKPATTMKHAIDLLEVTPKIILLSLPAGDEIDKALFGENGIIQYLKKGDIIIDGGNSFYKDSKKRFEECRKHGIHFIDIGISGGPEGARNGACLMIGGEKEINSYLLPLFKEISLPGGFAFFEGPGAGHFVKMVHNGIEYGMMQAIGEGFEVMKKSEYDLDLLEVGRIYNNGSVIESRLIGWLYKAYSVYGQNLEAVSGKVNATGEAEWTVKTAEEEKVPVKIIEESLKFRQESQSKPRYIGKVVSALRNMFGGHTVTEK